MVTNARNKVPMVVRATLRQHTDGMTMTEIANTTGIPYRSIYTAVSSMPDIYIDRWIQPNGAYRYQSVWCVVTPPANCPHPNK